MRTEQWYKDKVFYQIWPRSFKDGNGDGMGDLYGVYEKLDYIKSLGCDGIWFSPLYPSPGVDCGYDISDYFDIAEEFGGMDAFKKVLNGAHERGMKVIMDLVVNLLMTILCLLRKDLIILIMVHICMNIWKNSIVMCFQNMTV